MTGAPHIVTENALPNPAPRRQVKPDANTVLTRLLTDAAEPETFAMLITAETVRLSVPLMGVRLILRIVLQNVRPLMLITAAIAPRQIAVTDAKPPFLTVRPSAKPVTVTTAATARLSAPLTGVRLISRIALQNARPLMPIIAAIAPRLFLPVQAMPLALILLTAHRKYPLGLVKAVSINPATLVLLP